MLKFLIAGALVASIGMFACSNCCLSQSPKDSERPGLANIEFSIELYKKSCGAEGNVALSPVGISGSLAVALLGARAETQRQMIDVLRVHKEVSGLSDLFLAFRGGIEGLTQEGIQTNVANSFWILKGYEIESSFIDSVKGVFNEPVSSLDFRYQPSESADTMNDWVNRKTQGKIQSIITPEQISTQMKMIILSAVFFRGNWVHRFEEGLTTTEPFYAKPEFTLQMKAMKNSGKFKYARNDLCQALELPYEGNRLSMVALIPNDISGINKLDETLSADMFAGLRKQMTPTEVSLVFPGFAMDYSTNLSETLATMGMTDAFDASKADFSGISKSNNGKLFISNAFQKVSMEVSEEGTSAAAASSVTISDSAGAVHPSTTVVRADRPFVFLIMDNKTGAVLFIGRLCDPTIKEALGPKETKLPRGFRILYDKRLSGKRSD